MSQRSATAAGRGAKSAASTITAATRTSGAAAARAAQSAARATVRSAQAVATLVRSLVAVVAGTATSAPLLVGLVSVLSVVAVVASIIAAIFPTVNNTVSCTAPPKNAVGVAFGGYGPEQLKNASEIIRAGKDAKLDTRDITIGVMVAMGESSLRILAYGDAAGPDSRGLFQQRDSWGPLSVRMDAYGSAGLFFDALKRVADRPSKQPTIVAHETQRNADPNHYTKFWDAAVNVVSGAGGTMAGCDLGGNGTPGDLGKGDDYPFNNGEYNATNPVTGLAFKNCTDFAWWRLMQQLGITDQAQMDARPIGPGNGATWAQAWERAGWTVTKTPQVGSIIWYGIGNPGGHPIYGHVAVVKEITADGKVVEEGYNMAPDKLGAYYTRTIAATAPSGYLLIPTKEQYAKAI
ncbi:CHAP domain-containing protein [Paenarthrobacter ureafaciens]|uniref:CHAP domain-containing protein n=1 Tax=Paenarthrobacter ureafaciens TaxID=37931 RepID=UPI00255522FB|nr:CHAP domain-containing protein [Paenarthrobacter ureafaciens]